MSVNWNAYGSLEMLFRFLTSCPSISIYFHTSRSISDENISVASVVSLNFNFVCEIRVSLRHRQGTLP